MLPFHSTTFETDEALIGFTLELEVNMRFLKLLFQMDVFVKQIKNKYRLSHRDVDLW